MLPGTCPQPSDVPLPLQGEGGRVLAPEAGVYPAGGSPVPQRGFPIPAQLGWLHSPAPCDSAFDPQGEVGMKSLTPVSAPSPAEVFPAWGGAACCREVSPMPTQPGQLYRRKDWAPPPGRSLRAGLASCCWCWDLVRCTGLARGLAPGCGHGSAALMGGPCPAAWQRSPGLDDLTEPSTSGSWWDVPNNLGSCATGLILPSRKCSHPC